MSGVLHVEGIALWSPRLPGWEAARAVLRGERPAPEQPAPRPSPTLLAPTERRRAPDTVAIALEVALAATAMAGTNPTELPSVFASTHGDLAISDYMCATLAEAPTMISPTKFHNSVHNAAAGYWSIATGTYAPYTAISALDCTFAQGVLEAAMQVGADGVRVLLVAYDIEARGPLATVTPSRGLFGAALVLAPVPGPRTQATIAWRLDGAGPPRSSARHADLVAGNAISGCLPLFELLADAPGVDSVRLPASSGQDLVLARA